MIDIKKRKAIWNSFYDLATPVNRLILVNVRDGMPERPMLWWERADARVDWALARYQRQLELMELVDDHTVPSLNLLTGTEVFAEAFGCPVHRPADNNPYARPCVFGPDEAARLKIPRVEDTKFMILFDMARRLRERAGKDALLSFPDIQTPADVAALIWEKSDFYASMIEEPEAVREFIGKIRIFLFAFLDLWLGEFGPATMAHYPDYYLDGGVSVSEDEIGVVSASMYRDFFEDDLRLLSQRYGGIGIHSCADSRHQWENLKRTPGLRLINLHRNAAQTLASFAAFGRTCALMPMPSEHVDFDAAPESLTCHIADARPQAATVDEARRIADLFYERYPQMSAYAGR